MKKPGKNEHAEKVKYKFRLFIAGIAGNSLNAVKNLRKITENIHESECEIEIIDMLEKPKEAIEEGVLASPTLIKTLPLPVCKVIGDLSDIHEVSLWLGLNKTEKSYNKH